MFNIKKKVSACIMVKYEGFVHGFYGDQGDHGGSLPPHSMVISSRDDWQCLFINVRK